MRYKPDMTYSLKWLLGTNLQFFEQQVLNHISWQWVVSVHRAQKWKELAWNLPQHISVMKSDYKVWNYDEYTVDHNVKEGKRTKIKSSMRTYQVWKRLIIGQTKTSTVTMARMQLIGQIHKIILDTRIWSRTKQYNLASHALSVQAWKC